MLGPQTPPSQASISTARTWLAGCGWAMVGNETEKEAETLTHCFETFVTWMARFLDGQEPTWLTVVGPSGVGKTMLVRRVCEYISKFGRSVYEKTVLSKTPPMNRQVWQLYSSQQSGHPFKQWELLCPVSDENRARIERARTDWFAAIDELKPQTGDRKIVEVSGQSVEATIPKPFEIRAVDDLVNQRTRKWTLITSNLTRSQIAACWDVRIASRLTRDGSILLDLTGVRDFGLRIEDLTKASSQVSKKK